MGKWMDITMSFDSTDWLDTGWLDTGTTASSYWLWYPTIEHYYPSYVSYWKDESKIEKSFIIIQELIKMKVVKVNTVKDFIELVNKIAKII